MVKTVVNKIKGFTLVEMVVAAGLVGILTVGVVGIFLSTVKGGNQARQQGDLKTQGDFVMTTMERAIRGAVKMPECDGTEAITFSIRDDSGVISDREYRITDGGITSSVDGVDKGNLVSKSTETGRGFSVLAESSKFTCHPGDAFSPGSVEIVVTLAADSGGTSQVTQTFQTTVAIRNNP